MPDILVRGLDKELIARLKARAKRNGRSLQGEAKLILERAAGFTIEEARELTVGWQKRLAGRKFPDSAAFIRGGS